MIKKDTVIFLSNHYEDDFALVEYTKGAIEFKYCDDPSSNSDDEWLRSSS